jgi:hypothetical protein
MPIPDAVIPTERETPDQTTARLRYELVVKVCKNLADKSLVCGRACHKCEEKCAELQAYLDLDS